MSCVKWNLREGCCLIFRFSLQWLISTSTWQGMPPQSLTNKLLELIAAVCNIFPSPLLHEFTDHDSRECTLHKSYIYIIQNHRKSLNVIHFFPSKLYHMNELKTHTQCCYPPSLRRLLPKTHDFYWNQNKFLKGTAGCLCSELPPLPTKTPQPLFSPGCDVQATSFYEI